MSDPTDQELVRLAVERAWLSPGQVEEARASLPADAAGALLDRLVELGRLTPEQRAELRAAGASAAGTISSAETAPAVEETLRPQAGRLGRYRILEKLGHGAMGVVYRAEDTELHREVAVKTIRVGAGVEPELMVRFLREARTAAMLDHPGIVPIHDVGVIDGIPYFAMGLVRGRTFEQALAIGELPELRQRVGFLTETARAVAHAHERRVVHRDLKPSNLLRDEAGRAHVTDFGVAKRLDDLTRFTTTGEVVGTPLYMPPEQMNGERDRIGPASDVYSLGAILYEAAVGRPPWMGATLLDLLAQVDREEVKRPSRENPEVDTDLETVILKALEKDPLRRYPTAQELAEDLDRWLRGEPVQAKPISRSTRLWRKVVRHRVVAAPVAVVLLVGVGAAVRLAVTHAAQDRQRVAHLAAGCALRTDGKAREARDEFQRALLLDAADAEARAGFDWAETEVRRLEAEAVRTKDALRKAGLAQRVILRWMGLAGVLEELEKTGGDSRLAPAERSRRCEELWERVEPFVRGTPDDATSQATMRAFAGWARCLAGRPEDGLRWIREGAQLDPDLPYAAVIEALALFSEYVAEPLTAWTAYGSGRIRFWSVGDETPRARGLRERAEELLAEAEKAPVWGDTLARRFRGLAGAVRALREEQYEEAERGLTALLEAADLPMFHTMLLLARAKVRCYGARFAESLADLAELAAARPGWLPVMRLRGLVAFGVGEDAWRRDADPFPYYDVAIEALVAGRRVDPADPAWCSELALVHHRYGSRQEARGVDPGPAYAQALIMYGEVVRMQPDQPDPLYRRGNVRLAWAAAEARAGRAPLAHARAAVADFDVVVRRTSAPEPLYYRGVAWLASARAESSLGADPRSSYAHSLADFAAVGKLKGDPQVGRTTVLPIHFEKAEAEVRWGGNGEADLEAALAICDQWRKDEPENVDAPRGRVWALRGLGRLEEALREAEALGAAHPADERVRALTAEMAAANRAAGLAEAWRRVSARDYAGARVEYERVLAGAGKDDLRAAELATVHYDLACIHALLAEGKSAPHAPPAPVATDEASRQRDVAFDHLRRALESGFSDLDHLQADPDLASLRDDPRWGELTKR